MATLTKNYSNEMHICASFLNGKCSWTCGNLHLLKNFHWQLEVATQGWASIDNEDCLELAFCNPSIDKYELQSTISHEGNPICGVQLQVDFTQLSCQVLQNDGTISQAKVRRLSTKSYVKMKAEKPSVYATVWTWYWNADGTWKRFEYDSPSPMQSVIEQKYLAGQEIFRFEVDVSGASVPLVMLINYVTMTLRSLSDGKTWFVKRRPVKNCQAHLVKPLPYVTEIPENWYPVDAQHEFELVPMNPESMEYHLVASEFRKTVKCKIKDIFRLQNVHLWHKFYSKKKYIESRGRKPNETQLFHGTSRADVVQSIFTQNFDWRCAGKNATAFGKGAYFAKDASYSDNYTGGIKHQQANHWMFMARVLLGDHTLGKFEYTRPPPKDPSKPHGELYDSCVNRIDRPSIFVIFDSDQCYPEYVICYEKPIKPELW